MTSPGRPRPRAPRPAPVPAIALTIAGSDPSGGAGLQADLKTFAAFGVYGSAVVTCATAQNTTGVRGVVALPADFVAAQVEAVLDDLPVGAAKTGMLGGEAIVEAVAGVLSRRPLPLVVDPVMIATSGDRLLDEGAVAGLRARLLPLATLVTPNLPEAAALTGIDPAGVGGRRAAAHALLDLGARAVLLKGGHAEGPANDLLVERSGTIELVAERLPVGAIHGGGCSLAAAIAAGLAGGAGLRDAVAVAKAWVHEAIRRAPPLGAGARPLDHRVRPRRPGCG